MTPFLDQLIAGIGLVLGAASVGGIIWGAARRQRGREAVDEQHATKIATQAASSKTHATRCDDDHSAHRARIAEVRERVVVLETKLEALE